MNLKDLFPLIKSKNEIKTILEIKILKIKLNYSLNSFFILLKHQQILFNLYYKSKSDLNEKIVTLSSIILINLNYLKERIEIVKNDIYNLLNECNLYEKLLRQYSSQNYSLGTELALEGYLKLANEKFLLSEKEKIISDEFTTILSLCHSEISIDHPNINNILQILNLTNYSKSDNNMNNQNNLDESNNSNNNHNNNTTTTSDNSINKHKKRNNYTSNHHHHHQQQQQQQQQQHQQKQQTDIHNNNFNIEENQDFQQLKRQRHENYENTLIEVDEWSTASQLDSNQPKLSNPQIAEVEDTIIRSQSLQENEQINDIILSISDHTIIGSLSQISQIGSNLQSNEINISASSNYSSLIESMVQNTPSPEILQTQRSIKRNYNKRDNDNTNNQRIFLVENKKGYNLSRSTSLTSSLIPMQSTNTSTTTTITTSSNLIREDSSFIVKKSFTQ